MDVTRKEVKLEDCLESLNAILEASGQLASLNTMQRNVVRSRLEQVKHMPSNGTHWRDFMAKLEAS